MLNFQKFIKSSTKVIFGGLIAIMVISLTISFAPGGVGGEEDSGDAGVIFEDIVVAQKDFNEHKARATGHLRYREFQNRLPSLVQLKQLYQQYYKRDFTERDLAVQVSQGIQLKAAELNEKTWEQIILLQDAKDKGIAVSEEEAGVAETEFISKLGSDGKNWARQFLGVDRFNMSQFFREALMMEKLLDLVAQSQFPSYEEIYQEIVSGTEEGRVRYASLDPADTGDFLDIIGRVHPEWLSQIRNRKIKESKIQDYYQKNEWKFEIPSKIQAFYLLADFEEVQKSLPDPTEEEARKYYEENKESFIRISEEAVGASSSGTGKVYKPLSEVKADVSKKWKTREAKIRSNQAMREFEKWLSAQVAESVQLQYLLISHKGVEASLADPAQAGEEVDRLTALAQKMINNYEKTRKGRRRDFMPSVAASLRKLGPAPDPSAVEKYYEANKDDFLEVSGGATGEKKYKPLASVRSEIVSRLRAGTVLFGLSEDLKAASSIHFRELGEVVGAPDPAPDNWRDAAPRSWAFTPGLRVRSVSEVSRTTSGRVFFRLHKKTYGTKTFEDFQQMAKEKYSIALTTGITAYFDKENMKEVKEVVGEDVARGSKSTLSDWGFDAKRTAGDVSRQMETSKGYIVYRIQGIKEKYVPKTIIGSVRERILKVLLKDMLKERAAQLANEISSDINLHGIAKAGKKYGIEFPRSKYFKLNGTSSALDTDAALGREISRQVSEEKSGGTVTKPGLSVGSSRVFDGSSVSGKSDWSFVVYMEDRLDRGVDPNIEKSKFEEVRKRKETEIRDQYKKDYIGLVVNRANRKELLDSEGDSQ